MKGGEFLLTSFSPQSIFTPEDFSEEQKLMADAATDFITREVLPLQEEIEAQKEGVLPDLIKKAGKLGFLSVEIPEQYGGQNLDKASVLLITEKLSQGGGGFMVAYAVHTGIGSLPIIFFGNGEQKRKYLPKIATGDIITAYALTEPEAGSDALNAKTNAILSPDGKYYVLNGQKQFISNAGFADLFITYAKVDGEKFTSFIVERNFEGVSVEEEEKKMGMKGASTRAVVFTDAKIPVENVLGEIGKGHIVAFNTLNIGRFKLGGGCLGSSKVAIQDGISYAKKRVQFGRPICEFGLIKHKIAEMAIRIFTMESMVYRTAGMIDQILKPIDHNYKDSGAQIAKGIEEYAIEDSINKVYSSEVLDFVVDEVLQIYGGYGYIQDYPPERYYRDSRINRIWEGTNEINRLIITDMIIKRAFKDRLPIIKEAEKVEAEIFNLKPNLEIDDEGLCLQKEMIDIAKKITLLLFGLTFKRYHNELSSEQEVIGLISDMIIEIFAMESAFLRAIKNSKKLANEGSRIQKMMVKVYVNDMFKKIENYAIQVLASLYEGDMMRTYITSLRKITQISPVNTVSLRREIADYVIRIGKYPF